MVVPKEKGADWKECTTLPSSVTYVRVWEIKRGSSSTISVCRSSIISLDRCRLNGSAATGCGAGTLVAERGVLSVMSSSSRTKLVEDSAPALTLDSLPVVVVVPATEQRRLFNLSSAVILHSRRPLSSVRFHPVDDGFLLDGSVGGKTIRSRDSRVIPSFMIIIRYRDLNKVASIVDECCRFKFEDCPRIIVLPKSPFAKASRFLSILRIMRNFHHCRPRWESLCL